MEKGIEEITANIEIHTVDNVGREWQSGKSYHNWKRLRVQERDEKTIARLENGKKMIISYGGK